MWPVSAASIDIPFGRPLRIAGAEADRAFSQLLHNVYGAFRRRGEQQVYNSLAVSTDGELLQELYIQIQQGLRMQEQGGAVARVRRLEILDAELQSEGATVSAAASTAPGFMYRCRWNVSGTVEHWGHIHERTNQLEAIFHVVAQPADSGETATVERHWKFTQMNIVDSQRLQFETRLRNVEGPPMTTCQRRTFLKTAGRSGMAAALGSGFAGLINEVCPARETAEPTERFVAFTESFQAWPIPQVCQRFREMGLDGLDLTVRPGGHIAPEDVQAQLPAAAQAARDHGLRIHMLSTAVVSDDPLAERVLATAAESGIDRIKLGYIPYRTFGKLSSELDAARRTLERIVRLAEKHSVLPCVHAHSGATIPGNGPVAWFLLRDFTPKEIGGLCRSDAYDH
jgi:hypothetical protein